MSEVLAAARTVHFAATIWLFGELVFACALSGRGGRGDAAGPVEALRRRLPSVARASIAVGIASSVVWLAAVGATMSGLPLLRAIDPSTLKTVLVATLFGKVWIARLGIACALLLALWWPRNARWGGWRLAFCTVVAGAYLAALAWTGHAAAAEGPWRGAKLGSDVVHLLAAGAWLGALPSLAYLLGAAQTIEDMARAARRFSAVAIPCVSALVLSGIGNSWFLVGSIPALIGTGYGRLLLAKIVLLALMLIVATVNRLALTPRLGAGDRRAARLLRRNTLLEVAAGLLVLTIVGMLGITVPAAHQSPVWPFAHTLSLAPAQASAAARGALAAAAVVAAAGLIVVVAGARRRAWTSAAAGVIGIAASATASAWLLAIPAYPTTYAIPAVRYTTAAIVDGERLFATHCTACHGSDGTGAGPAAAGLTARPANLVRHAAIHRPGELYWWIAHGRAGTAMPAFAPPLGREDIWSIVQFLHALSDASALATLGGEPIASRPLPAPDFTFELEGSGQRTLLQQDEPHDTLLVLYSVPDSLARLRTLASERPDFDDRRIRVLAVTSRATDALTAGAQTPGGKAMLAIVSPDVAAAYAMFAARHDTVATSRHAEFLIDRRGRLHARWLGVPASSDGRTGEILDVAQKLDREPLLPRPSLEHAH